MNRTTSTWCAFESLPALQSLRIWRVAAPEIRFADLPMLRDVDFGADNLSAPALQQILRLPVLESLSLEQLIVSGETHFVFDALPRLRELSLDGINQPPNRIASIRIGNLPNLAALNISDNPKLRELQFSPQPNLPRLYALRQSAHKIDRLADDATT